MDKAASPGAPTLVLVPTREEARLFDEEREAHPAAGAGLVALCGFGPVAAAAATSRRLALLRPRRVLLLGIAGTYDAARHPVGSALAFASVALDGVGAGTGADALGPRELGLPQWRGADGLEVFDRLSLAGSPGDDATLLSVCTCSTSFAEAHRRRERFGEPAAEDMEGFGVALACHLEGVPLAIVRGISNEAGDRVTADWHVRPAMAAAARTARELLERDDWGRDT